ncbi:MFS transporter [Aeromicrobium alkaliterrae]|uniref:Multidrug efflux pump Tap n=1 Tax=Aeromicrobium alkaliterrae TaxID=302168 RepID=A0ABP4WAE1_9ACTN
MAATLTSVLRHRTYRRLFVAQVVALLGTGLLTVALSLLAFDVAPGRAGAVVATALTIKMVAYVLVAPVVTAVTSRWDPRRVLVGADLVRLAVAFSLPWVSEVWHVYALVLVLQMASATFTPTFQAVIPAVLTDERDYTRALSLSRLAYDLEALASPVLAAALLLVVDYHGLFVGTGAGFVLSALLVLTAGLAVPGSPPTESFAVRAAAGVRLFARRRKLRVLLLLDVATACATATVLVNTVVVVRQDLGLGSTALALTLGAFGGGSMVAAFVLPPILDRRDTVHVMLAGGLASALALLVAALVAAGPWVAVLVVWFVLGAATSAVLTPSGTVVNAAVSPDERPAAYAAHFSLSHACYLLAYPVAGWIGATTSVTTSAAVLAGVALSAAIGAGLHTRADLGETGRRTQ